MDVSSARSEVTELFLGLVFTSGPEEQVIDFFDRGLPAEYEIMRGIRVVAGTERSRVGVVKTMMDIVGGVNYQQNQFAPQWPVVAELRKQYDVFSVDPDFPISEDFDAILVPLPSSLQTDQMLNITNYIRGGGPALILVDPLPAVDPTLSPTEWVGDGNPYTYPAGRARPGPRGDVRRWLMELGIQWEPTRILWDSYNPHPDLAHLQSEFLFVGPGNGNEATFSPDHAMTAQLQELLLPFVGFLQAVDDPAYPFEHSSAPVEPQARTDTSHWSGRRPSGRNSTPHLPRPKTTMTMLWPLRSAPPSPRKPQATGTTKPERVRFT